MKSGKDLGNALGKAVLYVLVFLPAALGFAYVSRYGVNVTYFDTWTMVPLFEKLHEGTLTFSDLFEQFNEHRILVPRIVVLLVGGLTAFNDVAVMYLTQASLLLTLIVLLLAFRSSVSRSLLLFVPVPFLVFSLGQSWNMLQSFQIALVLAQTFSVATFYLLYRCGEGRRGALLGAVGSGMLASFSAAPGILVWPVGMAQILLLPLARRAKARLAGAWGLSGLAGLTLYFLGYDTPGGRSSLYVLDRPLESAELLLRMLGGSLLWQEGLEFWQEDIPYAAGLLLACLVLIAAVLSVIRRRELGESSFWIATVFFALLVLAGTALARGEGEEALNPKYVTYSILAVAGSYALLVRLVRERAAPIAAASLAVLTLLVAASIPVSYLGGLDRGEDIRRNKEEAAFVLATHERQPDEVLQRLLRPNPDAREELISTLKRLDYSVFSSPPKRLLPPPLSELSPANPEDSFRAGVRLGADNRPLGGETPVAPGDSSYVTVAGWAVDVGAEEPAAGVYVRVDGKQFPAFYGLETEAVAERLGNPTYESSGFKRSIPVSEIGPGEHELSISVLTSDGERCRSSRKLDFEIE